jgi:hypothetical protein
VEVPVPLAVTLELLVEVAVVATGADFRVALV